MVVVVLVVVVVVLVVVEVVVGVVGVGVGVVVGGSVVTAVVVAGEADVGAVDVETTTLALVGALPFEHDVAASAVITTHEVAQRLMAQS